MYSTKILASVIFYSFYLFAIICRKYISTVKIDVRYVEAHIHQKYDLRDFLLKTVLVQYSTV